MQSEYCIYRAYWGAATLLANVLLWFVTAQSEKSTNKTGFTQWKMVKLISKALQIISLLSS